jgi:glutathione reductase (NADPH)
VKKYDVVILGGGNAALGVAIATRAAGLSVAMIEGRSLGGTSLNCGCTPKHVLIAAAHALHEIERAGEHCITVRKPVLDWAALIERKKRIIRDISDKLAGQLAEDGVDVIYGKACFAGRRVISVGERRLDAGKIVIATGSTPRSLPIAGAQYMVTSDDLLNDSALPRDVVFVGGGAIAFEFGHVYSRAGAKVTILEALPHLLGGGDADAVRQIRCESERIGIGIMTLAWVKRIDRVNKRLRVAFAVNGKDSMIEADRIVNCTGRIANVVGLDLGAGVVVHREGRIEVDEFLRSRSNPDVYVCGDALWNSPQLSPVASYEGDIVGRNIVDGPRHRPDYAHIPASVYTIPSIASVGLTEAKARKQGRAIEVRVNNMRSWLSTKTIADTVAWSKVIVDVGTDRVLGAHIVGRAGVELIHIFALAMKHGITAKQLSDTVYGFPTFSSDIKNML